MFNRILVPLDGSPTSERALPIATMVAQATGAHILLVRATGDGGLERHDPREVRAYLDAVARRLGDGLSIESRAPDAAPAAGILAELDRSQADLVIMTTHSRAGLTRLVHGSVAEAVLAGSAVPVLLVRMNIPISSATPRGTRPCLLVPLDGSAFAEAALPPARSLARALDWTILLLRVAIPSTTLVTDPEVTRPAIADQLIQEEEAEAERYLIAITQSLHAEGLRIQPRIRVGEAAQAILDESQASGASLVVMASHGRTGLGRMMRGSVASEVLHRGSLPLLLVRPSGLKAPEPDVAAC